MLSGQSVGQSYFFASAQGSCVVGTAKWVTLGLGHLWGAACCSPHLRYAPSLKPKSRLRRPGLVTKTLGTRNPSPRQSALRRRPHRDNHTGLRYANGPHDTAFWAVSSRVRTLPKPAAAAGGIGPGHDRTPLVCCVRGGLRFACSAFESSFPP